MQHSYLQFRQSVPNLGAFVMVAFIITIYLSTAVAIVISCILGAVWLLTQQFRQLPHIFKKCPTATWAIALYLFFFIGLSYGNAPGDEAFSTIRKYRELGFIPLLACFFTDGQYRSWAWKAFVVASVVTLVGSYLMDFGILDMLRHKTFTLKSRITHSIFMAFFLFYCAHKAVENNKYKPWYLSLLIIGSYNLFFMVEGRTGQLVFMFLALLFAGQQFGKKGILISVLALVLFATLYISFSDKSARIREGFDNTLDYIHHVPKKRPSSMGLRYKFWGDSLKIIAEKPFLGYGTGSFAQEFHKVSKSKMEVKNPHNEFLMIAVQFGLAGLIVYLGFLYSQYWTSKTLPPQEKWLAQGLLTTLIVTSFFNSPFLDHTEGHWFAVMIALCLAPKNTVG